MTHRKGSAAHLVVAAESDGKVDGVEGARRGGTLICTVGLSPTPIALTVLTLEPESLVLVYTPSTASVAAAIQQLVAERDEYRDVPTVVRVVQLPEAEARDLHGIHTPLGTEHVHEPEAPTGTLLAVLGELGAHSPTLNYTGGTSVMVAGLVEFHRRLLEALGHSDAHVLARRSYVAIANDTLRFDDGETLVLDDSLSLIERASLHGVELSGWRRGSLSDDRLKDLLASLAQCHGQAARMKVAEPLRHWFVATAESGAFRFSAGASTARPRSFGPSLPPTAVAREFDGAVTEALTALLVEQALRLIPGGRTREVWINATANYPGESRYFVEIDLLVRFGNSVVAIEVKRSTTDAQRLQNSLFRLMRSTPLVFGASIRILLVPLISVADAVDEALSRTAALLGVPGHQAGAVLDTGDATSVGHALQRGPRANFRNALIEIFRGWSPKQLAQSEDNAISLHTADLAPEMPVVDDVAASALTVSGVGGNPLAVEVASLAASNGAKLWAVGSESLIDTLPLGAPILPVVSRFDPRSAVEARGALMRAAGRHRDISFIITPGTKAVTAAMVDVGARLARAGRHVELLHVDSEYDRIFTRSGASHAWRSDYRVDWEHALSAAARKQLGAPDLGSLYTRWDPATHDPTHANAAGPGPLRGALALVARRALSEGIPIAILNSQRRPDGPPTITPLVLLGGRRIIPIAQVRVSLQANAAQLVESQAIAHALQFGPIASTLVLASQQPERQQQIRTVLRTWTGAPLFIMLHPPKASPESLETMQWSRDGNAIELTPLPVGQTWSEIKAYLGN